MSGSKPATPNGVIAHLIVRNGEEAVAFYTKAFGARETYRKEADDGKRLLHAKLDVNGGTLMLADDFPEYNGGQTMAPQPGEVRGIVLHMQVPDCDATYQAALAAGAEAVMPPADMFWGDRYGQFRDPFGHVWSVAHTLPAK